MPRKALHPTDEDRRMVKMLAGVGMSREEIALKMGIKQTKTLRKYFKEELDLGAIEADARVKSRIYSDAMAGNTKAQELWLRYISSNRSSFRGQLPQQAPGLNIVCDPGPIPEEQTNPTQNTAADVRARFNIPAKQVPGAENEK